MPEQESAGEEVQQTETETPEASTSTDQPTQESTSSEQPSGSAASDETPSFIDNFDPKSLPDELVPAYKQMQGAFTKKTQAIAEERRSFEAIKRNADAYNVLMGNENVRNHVLDLLKGKQPEAPAQEDLSTVDIAQLTDQQLLEHQQKMNDQNTDRKIEEKMSAIEPIQRQLLNNGVRSTMISIRNALQEKYPDFAQYETQIAASIGVVNPTSGNPVYVDLYLQAPANGSIQNPLEEAIEGEYKKLAFDALHSTINQRANEKVQAKKNANLIAPGNSVKTTDKPPDTSKMSLVDVTRAAWSRGMKELGISSFEESQK